MADTLVLHIHDSQISQVSWLPLGKTPSPQSPRGTGTLEEAAEKIRGWRLLVIAPACEVLLTRVSIPAKNRQRLLQAIPYALENDLTEEIELLHFAIDRHTDNDSTSVAVISRQRLDAWLERFHALDLQPLAIYPELLCLPMRPGRWCVNLRPHFGQLRTGPSQGFCADMCNFLPLLKMSLGQTKNPPEGLDLYIPTSMEREFSSALLVAADCEVQEFDINQ